jgi:Uma2 family endonuclease
MLTSAMQPSSSIKLSPEQFFAWLSGQEGRYELVDGEVVMMAGAGRRHDRVVVNLIATLDGQLRFGLCLTFTGDTFVSTSPTTRRMPDVGVDCGKPDDDALTADKPSLVVEVLSPSTRAMDVTIKLQEYQSLDSLDYVLLVDTESPKVHFHSRRDDRSWTATVLEGLASSILLEKLNVELKLSEVYRGLEFRPKPKLVEVEPDDPGSTFEAK